MRKDVPALPGPLLARMLKALTPRLRHDVQAGGMTTLATLAIVLTFGLLAISPLESAAARVGITATFTTAIVGSLVYALRAALPRRPVAPALPRP